MSQQLTSSTKEVFYLEVATRDQHDSKERQKQKTGSVTASNAYRMLSKMKCKTASNESLLKSIMGQSSVNLNSPAVKHGWVAESHAADAYVSASGHKNLKVSKNGLFVLHNNAFLGASPDRLVHCDCCGQGLLEIKCPLSAANKEAYPEC